VCSRTRSLAVVRCLSLYPPLSLSHTHTHTHAPPCRVACGCTVTFFLSFSGFLFDVRWWFGPRDDGGAR
jgi:hypothetical protein